MELFKYLGEYISINGPNKKKMKIQEGKLENLKFHTSNMYNKQNLSINAEIRHYNTVVKTVKLYGTKVINLTGIERK